VVVGQKVTRPKVERSKQLRREMTPAEKVLWQALRNSQLAGLRFRRQQVIAGFIVDFYCHAAGLVVNVDGEIHRERVEADAERDTILTAHGLVSLHVTNAEVLNELTATLSKIEAACRQARVSRPDAAEPNHAGTPPRAGEGPGVRFA
jgi:very-short-patch-repair endonuclease